MDPNLTAWDQYTNGGFPYNVLIDTSMVVQYSKGGYNRSELKEKIEELLYGTADLDKTNKSQKFELLQNYPNPFNNNTKINFILDDDIEIEISVFDINGKKIQTLTKGFRHKGNYSIPFRSNSVNSGIYFYKLISKGKVETRKMILLK